MKTIIEQHKTMIFLALYMGSILRIVIGLAPTHLF